MYILAKNLPAFFPCPKIMYETKSNSNGLISLAKDV